MPPWTWSAPSRRTEKRFAVWARAVAVVLTGLALGAAVEAALRADGWTIDLGEPLTAHRADLAIEVRDDTGHRELAVTVRPDPTPALPVIAAGLAGAGIALVPAARPGVRR